MPLREARGWPQWVPVVAWNRGFLCDCILMIHQADGEAFYKVTYAMQRPYLVCLSKLAKTRRRHPSGAAGGLRPRVVKALGACLLCCVCVWGGSTVGPTRACGMTLTRSSCFRVRFTNGDQVFANGALQPFSDVAASFLVTPVDSSGSGARCERHRLRSFCGRARPACSRQVAATRGCTRRGRGLARRH